MRRYQTKFRYLIGTMIELPRAAVTADKIALEAEFFSFGTNDLTQTTFGFSRDDAAKFISFYMNRRDRCARCLRADVDQKTMTCRSCGFHHPEAPDNILHADPFATLDQEGVGELMRMAIQRGRAARPDIKLGICGEHGGDPASVKFCHTLGIDYVSCSPYRVPIARLAAAQAALEDSTSNAPRATKRRSKVRSSRPPTRARSRR
jgi:pyruvate,orthophosphate dikinase